MTRYRFIDPNGSLLRDDGACIPGDLANMDRIEFNKWVEAGGIADPYIPPVVDQTILSQDLMAQFTLDDATKIQAAVSGNVQFWLLWSAMQAQSEPMIITNPRFQQGWNALITVLGSQRMSEIATALGVTI